MARARSRVGRLVAGGAVAALLGFVCAAAPGVVASVAPLRVGPVDGQEQAKPGEKPAKKDALARLADPWPKEEELAERRLRAENLPLFNTDAPLAVTITGDLTAVNKDRTPDSKKRVPAQVSVEGPGGAPVSLPVMLGSRGHARLNTRTCEVVPMRLDFAANDVVGTVFEGQGELKLVTHCRNEGDYEQNVLEEYLAYRLFNLFTPRSFRARLVQVTYVDSAKNNRRSGPRHGMILERDRHVAERLGGRLYPVPKQLFRRLDPEALALMTLLQFVIGNTDYSVFALHNVRLVQVPDGTIYPIAYDFDYSGLVNASYAVANKQLQISSVRERLYRGPCLTMEELQPYLATFRARKQEALAFLDAIPALRPGQKGQGREYLEEFFSLIDNPRRTKRALVDQCVKAGM